jgi:hypothetical protein
MNIKESERDKEADREIRDLVIQYNMPQTIESTEYYTAD